MCCHVCGERVIYYCHAAVRLTRVRAALFLRVVVFVLTMLVRVVSRSRPAGCRGLLQFPDPGAGVNPSHFSRTTGSFRRLSGRCDPPPTHTRRLMGASAEDTRVPHGPQELFVPGNSLSSRRRFLFLRRKIPVSKCQKTHF